MLVEALRVIVERESAWRGREDDIEVLKVIVEAMRVLAEAVRVIVEA